MAQYHLDEQSRLLKKNAQELGVVRWLMQHLLGIKAQSHEPALNGEEKRILPEDYGRDDNAWVDTP